MKAWSSCTVARLIGVGKDGPRVNPFALEPTESNIKFLYSFVKLLLTNMAARSLSPKMTT